MLLIHLGKEDIRVQEWSKENTFEPQKMSWMVLISIFPYLDFSSSQLSATNELNMLRQKQEKKKKQQVLTKNIEKEAV